MPLSTKIKFVVLSGRYVKNQQRGSLEKFASMCTFHSTASKTQPADVLIVSPVSDAAHPAFCLSSCHV